MKQPCSLLLSLLADDLLYHSPPLVLSGCLGTVWVWWSAAWQRGSCLQGRTSAESRHVVSTKVIGRQASLSALPSLCPQLRVSGHAQSSVRPSPWEMVTPCPPPVCSPWLAPHGLAKLTISRPSLHILSPSVSTLFRVFFLYIYPSSLPLIV